MKNVYLAIVALFLSLSTFGQVINSKLSTMMANTTQPLEVVVTFDSPDAPTASDIAVLTAAGITKGLTLHTLPIAGVIATPSQITQLSTSPNVKSIYFNEPMTLDNHNGTAITGVNDVRVNAAFTAYNGGLPVSGKGIGVVINDSGIDGTHPDIQFGTHLVENVAAQTNLSSVLTIAPYTPTAGVPNTDQTGGHGTHVAGIVGATGTSSQGLYEGVAPGADLIGYGSGVAVALLDVAAAFDWAIVHQSQYGIRVVTNSWGSTGDVGTDFDSNHPTNLATKRCTDRNIVVVFSAGNSGSSQGTMTGNFKKAPWVISVAAGTKQGGLANFSSRGRDNVGGTVTVDGQQFTWVDRPTITAPGVDIVSTRTLAPDGLLGLALGDLNNVDPAYLAYYTTLSGTSMAAPHIAGIVALMLEVNPTLTPYEVKAILENTASPMTGFADYEVGAGYVDAFGAVSQIYTDLTGGNAGNRRSAIIGQSENPDNNALTIFPNPADTYLNINVNVSDEDVEGNLTLTNISGQVIHSQNQTFYHGNNIRLNVENLPAGLYFLNIVTSDKGILTKKVMVR